VRFFAGKPLLKRIPQKSVSAMSIVNKLLGLATVGSTLANVTLLHRFLSAATTIVTLTVLSACMCCILLAGGFYAVYAGLIHYGIEPYTAALAVGALVVVLTVVIVTLTIYRVKRLRELPYYSGPRHMPQLSHIQSAAHAFMDGLLNPRPSRDD
jgi:hypothetical protein